MPLLSVATAAAKRCPVSFAALVAVSLLALTGCSPYQLRGTVVAGPVANIQVVSANDARLDAPGMPSATISATLDPNTPNRKPVGSTTSRSDGTFALPIGSGAGFLIYDVHVVARRSGHQTAEAIFPLPKGRQRLLITLPEGRDQWKPAQDVVDETLELSKPYMDGTR